MPQSSFRIVSLVALASAFAAGDASSCPRLVEREAVARFLHELAAHALVVEYMTASKNGEAERASSLIDYEEWAKEMRMNEERAKAWAQNHRKSLAEAYRQHKAEGSTKVFGLVRATVLDETAVFEVTQERVGGVLLWEIKLKFKEGRWVIVGFRTLRWRQ